MSEFIETLAAESLAKVFVGVRAKGALARALMRISGNILAQEESHDDAAAHHAGLARRHSEKAASCGARPSRGNR